MNFRPLIPRLGAVGLAVALTLLVASTARAESPERPRAVAAIATFVDSLSARVDALTKILFDVFADKSTSTSTSTTVCPPGGGSGSCNSEFDQIGPMTNPDGGP